MRDKMKKISSLFLCIYIYAASAQPTPTSNIGIGTLSPTRAKLELHGSVLSTSAIFGGESSGISVQSNWPGIGFNDYGGNGFRYIADGFAARQYLNPGTGYMVLAMLPYGLKDAVATSSTNAFFINNLGNIGIKAIPVNASLFVPKGGNADGSALFGGTTYGSYFHYGTPEDTYIRGGKFGSKIIINDIDGGKILMGNGSSNVGINNGLPASNLELRQINGRGLLLVEPNNSFNNWEFRMNRPVGWIGSNLNLMYNGQAKGWFSWGTADYSVYSDRRLKKNIQNIPLIINKIMALQPVEYEMNYNNKKNCKTIGFIAQDVKKVFPELVTITTDTTRGYQGITDLHCISYSGFNVLAIKAIQEQQVIIKQMQNQNKELARRIAAVETLARSRN